uniref:Uncharacterized protein n=1 Tax=Nelumbo nucifera TaxID=4432 RepID=A0A822XV16_NELNU|nr:TPA_asm: hypothetical protein HUJ06_025285 [Nelumbo nucifera]
MSITVVKGGHSKLQRLEANLARARALIRKASQNQTSPLQSGEDYIPQGTIYHNAHEFHRSYLEMEKLFKIFVYEDGDPPLFHNGPCKGIYSTEGRFIHQIEINKQFLRTRDPARALVYFLPISIARSVQLLYVPDSRDIGPIKRIAIMLMPLLPNIPTGIEASVLIISCFLVTTG